jgi:hypothetical protein
LSVFKRVFKNQRDVIAQNVEINLSREHKVIDHLDVVIFQRQIPQITQRIKRLGFYTMNQIIIQVYQYDSVKIFKRPQINSL